jgi:hypothetical protein
MAPPSNGNIYKHTVSPPSSQTNNSRPCMELFSGEGEPDIRERPFEELPGLEGFNAFYRRNGGVV